MGNGSGWINSVEPSVNLTCNLVMDFTVRTKHPGRIFVEYWADEVNGGAKLKSKETLTVPDDSDNLATFQIARLRANTSYDFELTALKVTPGSPRGGPKYRGEFTSGELPGGLADLAGDAVVGRTSYPTLIHHVLGENDLGNSEKWRGAVILDEEGHIVWYYRENALSNIWAMDWLGDGKFLYNGKSSNFRGILYHDQHVVLANSFTGDEKLSPALCSKPDKDGGPHHDVFLHDDGCVYYPAWEFLPDENLRVDSVHKWNPQTGEDTKVFGLLSSGIFDLDDATGFKIDDRPGCSHDEWVSRFWMNSLQKIQEDGWLISLRKAGVVRLNEDKSIRWILTSLDPASKFPGKQNKVLTVSDDDDWDPIKRPNGGPYFQHSASRLADGNILMFDNGHKDEVKDSRVVEYSIDEANMTATKKWQYDVPEFSSTMSSAVMLENDRVLIGNRASKRIIEVTHDETPVLEANFQYSDSLYIFQVIPVESINGESYIST